MRAAIGDADLSSRFRGSMLGHALGDGLGAPFEGLSDETFYRDFGDARKVFTHPPVEDFIYTDDTEMAISIAECLAEHHRIDGDDLARRFHKNFTPTTPTLSPP